MQLPDGGPLELPADGFELMAEFGTYRVWGGLLVEGSMGAPGNDPALDPLPTAGPSALRLEASPPGCARGAAPALTSYLSCCSTYVASLAPRDSARPVRSYVSSRVSAS